MTAEQKIIAKGTLLYGENQPVDEISIIVEGKLIAVGKTGRTELKKGCTVGTIDGTYGKYMCNYFADEETRLITYPYKVYEPKIGISGGFNINPGNMVLAAANQVLNLIKKYREEKLKAEKFYQYIKKEYENYSFLCKSYFTDAVKSGKIEELEDLDIGHDTEFNKAQYWENLITIPNEVRAGFFAANQYITICHMNDIQELAEEVAEQLQDVKNYITEHAACLIGTDAENLFSLYEDLILKMSRNESNISTLQKKADEILAFANTYEEIDKRIIFTIKEQYKEKAKAYAQASEGTVAMVSDGKYTASQISLAKNHVQNAAEKIIAFAGLSEEQNESLRQLLTVFANMEDKKESSDEAGRIRNKLTVLFYEFYEAVFLKSEKVGSDNPVIDMFLNYGFMDEHLLTDEQVLDLYYLKIDDKVGNFHIYTMREWLHEILVGNHEPSRNEFDLDYAAALREEKKTRKVSLEEEKKYLNDQIGKVHFEISNMLRSANKITQGQVLSFCPVLYTDNEEDSIMKLVTQKSKVKKSLDYYLFIDFSCFYRPVAFWDTEHGVNKEYIMKEIPPVIILMPNIGTKGVMWQEISGLRKDTPARFAFSMFSREEINKIMVTILGQYRWEICRNIQGVYWNDLSEKSLTSEYFDYAQFFRKNRDLTPAAKEKIKLTLTKCKNSFRGMFVQDYAQWIIYESKGSTRLNKINREIIATYCPLSQELREPLKQHPAFSLLIEKYERTTKEKLKKANIIEADRKSVV